MDTQKKHRIIIYDEGDKEFDESNDDFISLLTKLRDQITVPDVPCILLDWHNVLDVGAEKGNPVVQRDRLNEVRDIGYCPIVMSWVGSKGGDSNDKLLELVESVDSGLLDDHTVIIWQCSMSDIKCGGKQLVAQVLGCTIQVDDKLEHLENIKSNDFSHFRIGYTEAENTDVQEHEDKSKEYTKLLDDNEGKDWDAICRDLSKDDRNKYKKCKKSYNNLNELRQTGLLKIINSWKSLMDLLKLCTIEQK